MSTEGAVINYQDLVFGDRLGVGHFGEVYRATLRGAPVAVKRLVVQNVATNLRDAFRTEVSVLMRLRHPRIVLLLGHTDPDATGHAPCMVLEFAEGGSLYAALHEERRPVDERQVAIDVAEGVSFLHNLRPLLLHRDLKSPNILLDAERRRAKICDFGVARIMSSSQSHTVHQAGTYYWMAPEVMRSEPYGAAADVYSFGVVLYELAAKLVPFAGSTPPQVMFMVLLQEQRPTLPPSIPQSWLLAIVQCWAQHPVQRPTMQAVLATVKALQPLAPNAVAPNNIASAQASPYPPPPGAAYPHPVAAPYTAPNDSAADLKVENAALRQQLAAAAFDTPWIRASIKVPHVESLAPAEERAKQIVVQYRRANTKVELTGKLFFAPPHLIGRPGQEYDWELFTLPPGFRPARDWELAHTQEEINIDRNTNRPPPFSMKITVTRRIHVSASGTVSLYVYPLFAGTPSWSLDVVQFSVV